MHHSVHPEPISVVTSLEEVFDEEAGGRVSQVTPRQLQSPTYVRDFTETDTLPNEDSEGTRCNNEQIVQNSSDTLPQSQPILYSNFQPSIVAVTATSADELGDLVGFETTPYGKWRSSIYKFYCQLYPTCFCSTFCPFLVIAQLNHKLRQKSFHSTVLYFLLGVIFIAVGCLLFRSPAVIFLAVLPLIYYAFHLRQQARERFKLPGSAKSDCLLSFCFPTCVIAQVSTYLTIL